MVDKEQQAGGTLIVAEISEIIQSIEDELCTTKLFNADLRKEVTEMQNSLEKLVDYLSVKNTFLNS